MQKGYIYHIINSVNGKRYVGKTSNAEKRLKTHFHLLEKGNHHSPKLQQAYNKYGKDSFTYEITEVEVEDEEGLSLLEMKEIDLYNSYYQGYNCTLGGEGTVKRFDFKKRVLLYAVMQNYKGVARKIGRMLSCEHSMLLEIQKNPLYSKVPYDEQEYQALVQELGLKDVNLNENYQSHNDRKLNQEQVLELLSIITTQRNYDKTMCEIFDINSKLTDRIKKGLVYQGEVLVYNSLTEEEKQQLTKDTLQKYNVHSAYSQRQRRCVKNSLTQEQVDYILDNVKIKTIVQVAKDLNISADRVSAVKNNKSYPDLIANYNQRHSS